MVKNRICQDNRSAVELISGCATIMTAAMYASTFFFEGVESNRIVYAVGATLSCILFMASFMFAKKYPWIIKLLTYATSFVFYIYGIIIGTITDPDQKTVTFVVMLVLLPVIFIDRPIGLFVNNTIYIVVFIYLCLQNKTGAILQNDVIDAIVFGILGLISGTVVNYDKVRGFVFEQKLQEISRYDQLTHMNNRNSYEMFLEGIPDLAEYSLACIYVDVNGLHELNNTEGHESGDEMLRYVADCIKSYFGEELTFRIGGDEFVIFVPDSDRSELEHMLDGMVKDIEGSGYFVATGLEIIKTKHLSMSGLIKSAESKMYQDKKQFYKNRVHDRRA